MVIIKYKPSTILLRFVFFFVLFFFIFSFVSFSFLFLFCLLYPILLIYRNTARQVFMIGLLFLQSCLNICLWSLKCSLLWKFELDIPFDGVLVTTFALFFSVSSNFNQAILSPWHQEWCRSIRFLISFQKKLLLMTFDKGNKAFDFWIGIPNENLKTMNHPKTLTMVSMETKVVSRNSFLIKLSEKLY